MRRGNLIQKFFDAQKIFEQLRIPAEFTISFISLSDIFFNTVCNPKRKSFPESYCNNFLREIICSLVLAGLRHFFPNKFGIFEITCA